MRLIWFSDRTSLINLRFFNIISRSIDLLFFKLGENWPRSWECHKVHDELMKKFAKCWVPFEWTFQCQLNCKVSVFDNPRKGDKLFSHLYASGTNFVYRPVCTSSSSTVQLGLSLSPKMLVPPRTTVRRHLSGNEACRS